MVRVSTVKRKSNFITTERTTDRYDKTSLTLDLNKCTGCNLCWTICPRYAIERGPIGASIRNRVEAPPIRINYHKCIFCGLCVYICPFNALQLTVNGRPTQKIKVGETLPLLAGEVINCRRTNEQAIKFIEGEIIIENDKCPGGCSTCIEICPTKCLFLPIASKEEPWAKPPKIGVNRENCIYCGACVFACPATGAVQLKRNKIKHAIEGSENKIWENIKNKIFTPVSSRQWFYEKREKTTPGGDKKLAPKRKELKE